VLPVLGDLYDFEGTAYCRLSQGTLLFGKTEDDRYSSSTQYLYVGILNRFVSLDSWTL